MSKVLFDEENSPDAPVSADGIIVHLFCLPILDQGGVILLFLLANRPKSYMRSGVSRVKLNGSSILLFCTLEIPSIEERISQAIVADFGVGKQLLKPTELNYGFLVESPIHQSASQIRSGVKSAGIQAL